MTDITHTLTIEDRKKLNFAQNLALFGYFSLFVILMINIAYLIPSKHFPISLVLLVVASPLLFPMMGLLKSNTYTYQWASFLSLAYFAHGISEMSAYPSLWFAGLLESVSALLMYIGCVMYARIFKKKARQTLKTAEQ